VLKKIAKVLINTENLDCLKKAESLEIEAPQMDTLNLRNLGLKAIDISAIANILEQEKKNNAGFIKSISFSYNDLIGDIGATEIIRSLPPSICEIGLVGCGIGDIGGNEILHWIKTLPNLKMICIEQNSFSDNLKKEFNVFKKNNPKIIVVI
jgi:hypothetical protein